MQATDKDRLIAEKVMESEYFTDKIYTPRIRIVEMVRINGRVLLAVDWRPTTDISQAFGDGKSLDTVVGMMRKKKWFFTINSHINRELEYIYEAMFYRITKKLTSASHEHPAAAIVDAALKAVE